MMMYFLLSKDLNGFMNHIGRIANFDYTSMPTIFEEAILVYLNMREADRETYMEYPIKNETFQRFYDYVQKYQAYMKDPQQQRRELLKYYGKTYWFYFHFYTLLSKQETEN